MKTKIIFSLMAMGMIMGTFAQKPSITLTFTAQSSGQHVAISSIQVENLTLGGDTTLHAPDTVLVLNYATGIDEEGILSANDFLLSQNYPNPVAGKTNICLTLPGPREVRITVSENTGRRLLGQEYRLGKGRHSFSFVPGRESLYFLSAIVEGRSRTIKLVNLPQGNSSSASCTLEYAGSPGGEGQKSAMSVNSFPFSLGNQLRYTATTASGTQSITDTPSGNQIYTFQISSSGSPCPGLPTITDIDGNVYNTVLIGDQCWMKENLKTTKYKNGTLIPNVTDNTAWSNLTTGAYAWYENDISWKDSYGALYNWYTTVESGGLCPAGWHVPTDAEWTVLTDHIGGLGVPHGNELKSCRQVSSPLGGICATSDHPRWNQNDTVHGTDDVGFAGLPAGYRGYSGEFFRLGSYSPWWSSTEGSPSYGYGRSLSYGYSYIDIGFNRKNNGGPVRCVRDVSAR